MGKPVPARTARTPRHPAARRNENVTRRSIQDEPSHNRTALRCAPAETAHFQRTRWQPYCYGYRHARPEIRASRIRRTPGTSSPGRRDPGRRDCHRHHRRQHHRHGVALHSRRSHRTAGLCRVDGPKTRAVAGRYGRRHGPRRACRSQTSWTGRRARAPSRQFAAFTFQSAALTGLDVPSRISTVQATRNLLDVWGITPQIGRTFAADEATPGRERVIVVSHAFWQTPALGRTGRGRQDALDRRPSPHDRRRAACRPRAGASSERSTP